MKHLLIVLMILPLLACAQNNISDSFSKTVDKTINSYEDCVKAGNPILRSLPPKCRAKDGRMFVKGKTSLCKDSCGDGNCQEITCLGEGCPCHENHETCPADCKN